MTHGTLSAGKASYQHEGCDLLFVITPCAVKQQRAFITTAIVFDFALQHGELG